MQKDKLNGSGFFNCNKTQYKCKSNTRKMKNCMFGSYFLTSKVKLDFLHKTTNLCTNLQVYNLYSAQAYVKTSHGTKK